MLHIPLTAEARPEKLPKSQCRNLRKAGRVLASVYGKNQASTSVLLSATDIHRVLASETGANTLIDLSIGGVAGRRLARIVAIEMEPITKRFRHIGLHVISATDSQKATVSVEFSGEPDTVRNKIAVLVVGTDAVDIAAPPEDLLGHVALDVSQMVVGDVKYVRDLQLPARVELLTDPDTVLVSLRPARVVAEEPAPVKEVIGTV